MTFSRALGTTVHLTAYTATTPSGETGLQISIGGSYAQLPEADAQALADYLNEKFPRS